MSNAYSRSIKKARDQWSDSTPPECMICGKKNVRFDIHEILRRSQAPRGWGFVENYLKLCRSCHDSELITHSNYMSICIQLRIKSEKDPENYDLEKWNLARNPRAGNYVTEADIARWPHVTES